MNQFPTTAKQLELYRMLEEYEVEYVLVGALASVFYGRNRVTKDVDLLINKSKQNSENLYNGLKKLSYPLSGKSPDLFYQYERVRIGWKLLVDVHLVCGGMTYQDVEFDQHEYDSVKILVAKKHSLIAMMEGYRKNSEDVRVLKLLDDPVANENEINLLQ